MRTYIKSYNSAFLSTIRTVFVLSVFAFLATAPAFAAISEPTHTYTFYPVLDYGSEDYTGDISPMDIGGSGADWSYICELGDYQAWFGFDVSTIPDGESILSASFTASICNETSEEEGGYVTSSQRTVWYESDDDWIDYEANPGNMPADEFIGQAWDTHEWQWLAFNLDLSQHDWNDDLDDDYISLMLSGPLSGNHECGEVDLSEGGYVPYLEITTTVPEPATICLLGLGVLSLLRMKRKSRM